MKHTNEVITNIGFRVWLRDYIEVMEYEVEENEEESYHDAESNGELEDVEDYYCLGLSHGEQKGVLDTLKLIKERYCE